MGSTKKFIQFQFMKEKKQFIKLFNFWRDFNFNEKSMDKTQQIVVKIKMKNILRSPYKEQTWKQLVLKIKQYNPDKSSKELQEIAVRGWEYLTELNVDLCEKKVQKLISSLSDYPNLQTIFIPPSNEPISLKFLTAKLPKLKSINLSDTPVIELELTYLFNFKGESLTSITLPQKAINSKNAPLFQFVQWPVLQKFDAYHNQISPKVFDYLAIRDKNFWPHLNVLVLWRASLGPIAIKSLIQLELRNLQKLDLNQNNIEDRGAEYLAAKQWKNLAALNIKNNNITEDGFKFLAKGKWRNLQYLGFTSPGLKEGEPYGISRSCLDSLVEMRIKHSRVEEVQNGKQVFIIEPRYTDGNGKKVKARFIHRVL